MIPKTITSLKQYNYNLKNKAHVGSKNISKSICDYYVSFKGIKYPNKAYMEIYEGDFLFSQEILKLINNDLSSKSPKVIEQNNYKITLYKDHSSIRFILNRDNKIIAGTLEELDSEENIGIQFDEPSALGKKELIDYLIEIASMLDQQYPNMAIPFN